MLELGLVDDPVASSVSTPTKAMDSLPASHPSVRVARGLD